MRPPDIAVVILYLTAVVVVGIASRGRKKSADEYFTAHGLFGGRLGTVLVGLSIAATFFSGISLIVYISSAYSGGIQIAVGLVALPVSWLVLHFWFLPRFLSGNWLHPYDIIEKRFGIEVRLTLSAMFALMRIGWMGVLVYAPAVVILGTADLGPAWFWPIVLAIGLSSTLYTVIGGIRSVIITDAIQFLVVALGMIFIGTFLWSRLDLSTAEMVSELGEAGRLELFNFSFDPTLTFTFWAILIGGGVGNVSSYLSDQMALQRYLTSDTPKEATRSFLINIVGAAVVVVTLVCVGLLLSLWYRHHPDPDLPVKPDRVVSYFIANELPVGISGLLIAAILAATMSSMTSGVNALAGAFTNDWMARFGRKRTAVETYQLSRRSSLVIGISATAMAGLIERMGTMLNASQIVMGLFLGPMLACMILAITKIRITPRAMLTGMACGTAAGGVVVASPAAGMWVSPVAFVSSLLVPLAAATLFRGSSNQPKGVAT
ncbi:MAG: hypothetical protein R3F07_11660 [Opitutaceae bacterium]